MASSSRPAAPKSTPAAAPTYADAGVSIDAGNALVDHIKPLAKATTRAGVMGGIGGFGALFDMKALGYRDPLLVSTTDGVGTKLKIAIETNQHATIGIDLVAMCVNDLVVQGAEPLFFLDYFATGQLQVDTARTIIAGIAEGCRQAGCALVGGETAEMPGMYHGGDYDLAGFAVGAVERDRLLPLPTLKAGDVVLGLASSGVHSNGYSLVRHVLAQHGIGFNDAAPFAPGMSVAAALLAPTRIYVKALLVALSAHPQAMKALAHITGGGLLENIPRVLPPHLGVTLTPSQWPLPPVFSWLRGLGNWPDAEFYRTFNGGIGMIAVVDAAQAADVQKTLEAAGEQVFRIGEVTARAAEAVVIA